MRGWGLVGGCGIFLMRAGDWMGTRRRRRPPTATPGTAPLTHLTSSSGGTHSSEYTSEFSSSFQQMVPLSSATDMTENILTGSEGRGRGEHSYGDPRCGRAPRGD
eukprot:1191774-Prorocentrum_minimum.AAC.2